MTEAEIEQAIAAGDVERLAREVRRLLGHQPGIAARWREILAETRQEAERDALASVVRDADQYGPGVAIDVARERLDELPADDDDEDDGEPRRTRSPWWAERYAEEHGGP